MNNPPAHPTYAGHSARILRRQQGLQALEQNRPLEAAGLLRAALDEGVRLGEHDEAHLTEWMLLGDALTHSGQSEDALEAYFEALDFLRGPVFANPVGSYARGLKMRARAYRVEYLYQRVDCEMDCLSERARTHSLLLRRIARLECALGRLESGLLRLWEAQFLLENLSECDVLLERLALDLEGAGVLTRLGDLSGAREVVCQSVAALGFLESGMGAPLLGQAHRLLGQLCWGEGDLEQAGRHLGWALESFRTAGHRVEVAHAQQDLARVLAQRGDFDAAYGHLERAGESVSLRGNPLEAYRLDHARAEVELLAGNLDVARRVLEPLLGYGGVPLEEQRRTQALWELLSGVQGGEPFTPLNGPGSYPHGWDGEGCARARQAWWGEAVKLG